MSSIIFVDDDELLIESYKSTCEELELKDVRYVKSYTELLTGIAGSADIIFIDATQLDTYRWYHIDGNTELARIREHFPMAYIHLFTGGSMANLLAHLDLQDAWTDVISRDDIKTVILTDMKERTKNEL